MELRTEPLVRAVHVASVLGCTTNCIKRAVHRGVLPGAIWDGTLLYFEPAVLKAFFARRDEIVQEIVEERTQRQRPHVLLGHQLGRGHSSAGGRRRTRKMPDPLATMISQEQELTEA
jgi:hypothetical protein